MNRRIISMLFYTLITFSSNSWSWNEINDNIDLNCQQQSRQKMIQCNYRSLDNSIPTSIKAEIGSQDLPVADEITYPWLDATSSVLFMIDTSDPARQNVVAKNLKHVESLLNTLKPMHRAGLASFDKNLRIHAPLGSSKENIIASMPNIKAAGKTTELYRNLIEAIQLLAKSQSDRKTIFIFSDGLAEDRAYFHKDVVEQARKNKVVITSLGYPRSTAESVALQRLRRISEETGGIYTEASSSYEIESEFITNPFSSIDNGGRFNIDLSRIDYSDESLEDALKISVTSNTNQVLFNLPVNLPKPKKAQPINESTIAPVPAVVNEIPVATVTTAAETRIVKEPEVVVVNNKENSSSYDKWLLYSLPIALIALLVLTIATFVMTILRPKNKSYPIIQTGDLKPFAYLVLQDESQRRYPITRTTWRIGRSKDNELSYSDNSISRRHCEIHREHGDVFTLLDLNSLNGVFVNNEKVKIHQLKEGDMLEIGDVNFRFTLLSSDYSLEEATSIQKTKIPPVTQH